MRPNAEEPEPDRSLRLSQRVLPVSASHGSDSTVPDRETYESVSKLSQQSLTFGLSEAAANAPDPLIGVTVGGVTIDRLLAEGGMGRVYLGTQQRPSRTVAIKFMRHGRSAASLERFRREAEVLGRLSHPGVARVFFTGSFRVGLDEVPFSVMEYVPNADTLVRFCNQHAVSVLGRLHLFLQACDAVAYGHSQGVVHRDLKPGNILVTKDGSPTEPRVTVIDFGIAKMLGTDLDEAVTATGEFLGTRQYMSPEQLSGSHELVDARTDVYALGVLLHELLTGKLPHDLAGRSLAETFRIVSRTRPRNLNVDENGEPYPHQRGLRRIADRCLAKQPADRYATAAEVADDIRRLLAGTSLPKRPAPRSAAAALIAIAMAMSCIAVGLYLLPSLRKADFAASDATPPAALTAKFTDMPAQRSSPMEWVMVSFSSEVDNLHVEDFRLTHDGVAVPLTHVVLKRDNPKEWRLEGLTAINEQEGDYVLTLLGGDDSPKDTAGRMLPRPLRVSWTMPPYHVWKLTPLSDSWKEYLVSMDGMARYTEKDAGSDSFFKPTVSGQEGSMVFRFQSPFPVQFAELSASTIVWTTGDPFPYDPGARASLDVSADGVDWTEVDTREAGQGGRFFSPVDISAVVAGSTEVWVRARLVGTVEWPIDGLIHSQFLRTNKKNFDEGRHPFVLQVSSEPRVRSSRKTLQTAAGPLGDPPIMESTSLEMGVPPSGKDWAGLSTPNTVIGQVSSLASAGRVVLSPDGSKAVVNAEVGQLCILDIQTPETTELVGDFWKTDEGGFRDFGWSPDGATVYAITHETTGGLYIIDVADCSAPSQLGFFQTPSYAHEIALAPDGNTVFIADGNTGLLALDVRRPDAPTLIGMLSLSAFVQGVTLSSDGKTAFLPCYQDGLIVVDVSNPVKMFRVGHAALPGNAWRITRSPVEDIIYVITRDDGYCVVDVTNLVAPSVVTTIAPRVTVDRLIVSAEELRMYAALRNEGIGIFDIASPSAPQHIETHRIAGRPIDFAVFPSTDTGLVAALDRGLLAVRLTRGAGASQVERRAAMR